MATLLARTVLAGLVLLLSACGYLNSFRMLSPSAFGMDEVNPTLFVEPAMETQQRQELVRQIALGRVQVERFYGSIETTPYIVACATEECAKRFGSGGARADAFGDTAIRLAPRGLAAPSLAHEWSHTELYRRVGGWSRILEIPCWFNEGLAVVVADEPRHSEANWREIRLLGLPTPALGELISYGDWNAAVKKYGENEIDKPNNLRVVYSAAGHEVRRWLSCAGSPGVLALLDAVRQGEPFEPVYQRLGEACATTTLPAGPL